MIDWTPFFQTWEMKGRFPAILEDEKQGEAARALWDDAQAMLKRIVEERWFNPKAVIGFWPANAVGDDIRLYTGESRTGAASRPSTACASSSPSGTASPMSACPTSSRRKVGRRSGLHRRLRGHLRASRKSAISEQFEARQRRLPLDHGQGAGRPHRGGLRRAHAPEGAHASSGAMPRTRRSSNEDLIREEYRASAPRRAIRPSPTIPRRRRCSACWRPSAGSA